VHDETLERRLRDALRIEGDAIALTITLVELERRLALRRRADAGRRANLLLAATVGIGLLGAVGATIGWFDPRPLPSQVQPLVSPVASATHASLEPQSSKPLSPGPVKLPTLDELIATVGSDRVVAAQSFGRSDGTEDAVSEGSIASIDLGPIARTAQYRVWIVCANASDVRLVVHDVPEAEIVRPVECTGESVTLDERLVSGARLKVQAPRNVAWRAVLAWQGDPVVDQPASIVLPTPDPATIIIDAGDGPLDQPNYGPVPSAWLTRDVQGKGPVPTRDGYSVLASCAGPDRIRYAIARSGDDIGDDDWIVQVELPCDGRLHRDDLGFSLSSGSLVVSYVPMVQWRLMLVGEAPPLGAATTDADRRRVSDYG
jgi:hypothetical protein